MTIYKRHTHHVIFLLITASVVGCAPRPLVVPAARLAVPLSSSERAEQQARKTSADDLNQIPSVSTGGSLLTSGAPQNVSAESRIAIIRDDPVPFIPPQSRDLSERFAESDKVSVAADGLTTRLFINQVFAELLKVPYVIAEGVPGLDAPVNVATPTPISSRSLFRLVADVLSSKGLSIVEKDKVFFVGPADAKIGGLALGYGRTPEDVPQSNGLIRQFIPLRYGLNPTMQRAISDLANASVIYDERYQSFVADGSRDGVLKVLDLVKLFDQPANRATRVGIIKLTYLSPSEFINQITMLMQTEGIQIGPGGAVTLVPMERAGSVIVFASRESELARLEFWTGQLDKPGEGVKGRYFIFQPKFARAAELGASVIGLLTGSAPPGSNSATSSLPPAAPRDTRSAFDVSNSTAMRRDSPVAARSQPSVSSVAVDGLTLTVDELTNSLIFFTTGARYESLLPLLKRLDIPPKQILLEVTIAEVSLTGDFARGFEYAFVEGRLTGSTSLGLPSGGLALTFNQTVANTIRARLTDSSNQVNLVSSPSVVVRDRTTATISVGNDVPTVGATVSDPLQSDKTVTAILYRKTGLNLAITPIVNAEGSILLNIQQSLSSAQPGSSGVQGAPVFFDRQVATEVVAQSGQSVLLAGLISTSESKGDDRVPFIGRIPALGAFFSSSTKRRQKTELVLLVTPRLISDPTEWPGVFRSVNDAFTHLQLPNELSGKPVTEVSGASQAPGGTEKSN